MFEDKIDRLRAYGESLEARQGKKLEVEQFRNLLMLLSDRGLIPVGDESKDIRLMIEGVFTELQSMTQENDYSKKRVKAYRKSYGALLGQVKAVFGLVPTGSIQSQYVALGMIFGSAFGALMSVQGRSTMMSLGISLGLVFGAGIGLQKEKEAKDAGKCF